MAKINKVYPSFFNGVSEQSPELILDSQCKEMVNCVPDVVKGVSKRPPVEHVLTKTFTDNPELTDASIFHVYDRGEDDEEYIMLDTKVSNDPVNVYNKSGEKMIVTYDQTNETQIKDYLANSNLKGLTVQDRTWLYSKNVNVALDYDATAPIEVPTGFYPYTVPYDWVAYLWIKRGSGDRYNPFNYAVYINGTTVELEPVKPSNSDANPPVGAEDSDFAASALADKINAASLGVYAFVKGSIIKIVPFGVGELTDFTFSSWDSWGNQASFGWKGSVNKISDLPKDMPFDDVYVKVKGVEGNEATDYFVKWNGSSWEECIDPNADRGKLTNMPLKMDRIGFSPLGLNLADAPFFDYDKVRLQAPDLTEAYYDCLTEQDTVNSLLIYSGYKISCQNFPVSVEYLTFDELVGYINNGEAVNINVYESSDDSIWTKTPVLLPSVAKFEINLVDWSIPRVGTEDNNPDPSFVGRKVQEMFFYKNRLGIASEDSISLTETANYTNFYATTAIDIVDTDAIDITVSSNQASKIYYAKPFNNSLYIFTKYAQYELIAEGAFGPSTVSLVNTSNYPMAVDVEPVVLNDRMYFVSTTSNRQQLREYIKTDNLNVKGVDLNVSTPTYIKRPVSKLLVDGVAGCVLCCTNSEDIYVYNFKEDGTNRVQSAWSKWNVFQNYASYSLNTNAFKTAFFNIYFYGYTANNGGIYEYILETPLGQQYQRGDLNEDGTVDSTDKEMFHNFVDYALNDPTHIYYSEKGQELLDGFMEVFYKDPAKYAEGVSSTGIQAGTFEYNQISSTVLITFKGTSDYRYHNLKLDYSNEDGRVDSTREGTSLVTLNYRSLVTLPDYYPKLGDVRTPLNKVLIKRVKIEGDGEFSADVYRKDYDTTYSKLKNYSMQDLDLSVASKVGNVDITVYDDSENNFNLTSVVVEGLFNSTSREMR